MASALEVIASPAAAPAIEAIVEAKTYNWIGMKPLLATRPAPAMSMILFCRQLLLRYNPVCLFACMDYQQVLTGRMCLLQETSMRPLCSPLGTWCS